MRSSYWISEVCSSDLKVSIVFISSLLIFCRRMDRCPNTGVGATAAQIARHRGVYLVIRRVRLHSQERCCLHHLPRLAISALCDLMLDPCLLNGVARTTVV